MMDRIFTLIATRIASAAGQPLTFAVALCIVAIWGITGPVFGYSDTWQLIINTGTTIVTFLMVFLIQNTQNRDSAAIHLKLDELIGATDQADNQLMLAEDATDDELETLKERYRQLCEQVESQLGQSAANPM